MRCRGFPRGPSRVRRLRRLQHLRSPRTSPDSPCTSSPATFWGALHPSDECSNLVHLHPVHVVTGTYPCLITPPGGRRSSTRVRLLGAKRPQRILFESRRGFWRCLSPSVLRSTSQILSYRMSYKQRH